MTVKNTIATPRLRQGRKQRNLVSYQTPNTVQSVIGNNDADETESDETEAETEGNKVSDYVLNDQIIGDILSDTFSIKVQKEVKDEKTGKMKKVVLYKNDEEPYQYKQVNSWPNLLLHLGAKLTDDKIQFLGSALVEQDEKGNETEDSKATAKALVKLLNLANAKLKADAKASAYSSVSNKHKPLEGAERDTAIARTIKNMIKLSNGALSPETVITVLKAQNAVPQDYTVEDYENTPLRAPKGSKKSVDEDEDDE